MTYRTSETAGPARPSRARAAAFVVVLAVAGACVEEPAAPPPGGTAGPTGDTVSRDPSELGEVRVELRLVATLEQPLALAVRKGDDALYVAEKTGRVVALRDGATSPRWSWTCGRRSRSGASRACWVWRSRRTAGSCT